jgi:hypothetical protein
MRLNSGEGNGASLAGRTSQSIARIDRVLNNMVICRIFVRSVLTVISTRAGGSIDRSLQIATAD